MKTFKHYITEVSLKDIVKREKESSSSGSETSKSIRIMTKEIKKENSDDIIIVKLSDDGDSVMRVDKSSQKLSKYLKNGYQKVS